MKKNIPLFIALISICVPLLSGEAVDKELMSEMDDWFPYVASQKNAPVKKVKSSTYEVKNAIVEKSTQCCPHVQSETVQSNEPVGAEQSGLRKFVSNKWVQGGAVMAVVVGVGWKLWQRKQS